MFAKQKLKYLIYEIVSETTAIVCLEWHCFGLQQFHLASGKSLTAKPERRRGRPRVTWQHVVIKDFEKGGMSWEEAMSLTTDRRVWRNWNCYSTQVFLALVLPNLNQSG